ncbi:MAG: hypothetical protein RL609_904 [Bacteroidota bacterium]|jgi:hypothetical protein
MKMKIKILIAAMCLSLAACKTKKQVVIKEEDGLGAMSEMLIGNDGFIEVRKEYVGPAQGDAITINGLKVVGDSLYVEVQYSGGCQNHEFTMITNGNFLKSLPPQLPLFLEHNANGDNCRALKMETLKYDLKPLRSSQTKKIKVFVNDDKEHMAEYSWK